MISLGGTLLADVKAEEITHAVESSIPTADVRLCSCYRACKGTTHFRSVSELVMVVYVRGCV